MKTQLSGKTHFTEDKNQIAITFSPTQRKQGKFTSRTRRGLIRLNSDGSYEITQLNEPRSQATLIKKLPHGRLSRALDGSIILSLKFSAKESNIAYNMNLEAFEATAYITE